MESNDLDQYGRMEVWKNGSDYAKSLIAIVNMNNV
jgi:hypothetical protein